MAVHVREPTTELQIVNPDPRFSKAELIEPTTLGYIYIAASVRPSSLPFVLPNAERRKLLRRLKRLARTVQQHDEVVNASVFRAIVMPPTARMSSYLKGRGAAVHVADFDVMVLVQTASPATASDVRASASFDAMLQTIRSTARSVRVMTARNARRIADVDTSKQGLFLFNHFAADDQGMMLELWEYLADWYVKETGLRNSVAMVPVEGESSDYAIVNWARWEERPLLHFWRQLANRSFWRYVPPNLEANHAASMPIYCRLA